MPKSLFTSRALGSLSVTRQALNYNFQGSGMYRRQKLISNFSPPRFFHFSSLDFSYASHLLTSFQCKRFSCQNNVSNGILWSTLHTLSCVFLRPSLVGGRAPDCKAMFRIRFQGADKYLIRSYYNGKMKVLPFPRKRLDHRVTWVNR